ncbi:MAG: acyltransferase family protein [Cellulosilyticaceae bacterium]
MPQDQATPNKAYPAIDLTRFICSLLVIVIHFTPLSTNHALLFAFAQGVSRLAVPFFFITSGYFLGNKDLYGKKTNLYLVKILKLYLIWSAIYFPYEVYLWYFNDISILEDMLLSLKRFILIGPLHLWYFPATIFAVMILRFFLKRLSIDQVLIISFILYLLGLLGESYYGLLSALPSLKKIFDIYLNFFETTRNGIFFGLLYVSLGYYINFKKITIKKSRGILYLGIGIVLMLIEIFTIKHFNLALDYNMYFSILPTSFILFNLIKTVTLSKKFDCSFWRKSSVLIFEIHFIVSVLVLALFEFFNITKLVDYTMFHILIIISFSILISILILQLENRKKFEFLKKLH